MTLAVVSEADLRMELWRSFISVLRAYAAVAHIEANHEQASNLDDTPAIAVWSVPVSGSRNCGFAVGYDAKTGKGDWHVSTYHGTPLAISLKNLQMSRDTFTLNPDGTVLLDGSCVDMDHAAIQMVASFTAEIDRVQMKVPA